MPISLGLDLGFEGLEIPGFKIILPTKKPKGKELTEIQKNQNKTFSQIRVKVENAICGVKRSRAVFDTCRKIKLERLCQKKLNSEEVNSLTLVPMYIRDSSK